ncbi:MAG: 2'-5' RNA ligase family protein [Actinomycetaceae bacterium]|nr:2'-5' RNA ligase family protein [Actinomycetaceae bacterium]
MEPDEELIGILVAVPEPWMSELSDLRASVGDKHAEKTPAHITLMPPTAVKIADREKIMEELQAIAAHNLPFTISLKGTGTFRPVSPVVFINVEKGQKELISLAKEMRSGILAREQRFPYHPHVTIAQVDSDEQLDRAQAIGKDFEATWTAPGFRLDSVSADGSYHSRAIFSFTAG